MFERVKAILEKYTEKPVTEDSALEADLDLTSFDVVSIVMDFENEFGVEISDRDMAKFIKVNDITDYLRTHEKK